MTKCCEKVLYGFGISCKYITKDLIAPKEMDGNLCFICGQPHGGQPPHGKSEYRLVTVMTAHMCKALVAPTNTCSEPFSQSKPVAQIHQKHHHKKD